STHHSGLSRTYCSRVSPGLSYSGRRSLSDPSGTSSQPLATMRRCGTRACLGAPRAAGCGLSVSAQRAAKISSSTLRCLGAEPAFGYHMVFLEHVTGVASDLTTKDGELVSIACGLDNRERSPRDVNRFALWRPKVCGSVRRGSRIPCGGRCTCSTLSER